MSKLLQPPVILVATIAALVALALLGPPAASQDQEPSDAASRVEDPMLQAIVERGYAEDADGAEELLRFQDAAIDLSRQAYLAHPQEFAGSWVDHERSEIIVALATPEAATIVDAMEFPASARGVEVEYSMDELLDVMTLVSDEILQRSEEGLEYGARLDIQANRVTLHLSDVHDQSRATDDRDSIRDSLPADLADIVELTSTRMGLAVDEACPTPDACDPPLRGGIRVDERGTTQDCTGGFVMNAGGQFSLTTASHCAPNSNEIYDQDTDTVGNDKFIGQVQAGGSIDAGQVDAARIPLNALSTEYWKPSRWVRHSGAAQALAITGKIAAPGTIPVGVFVCRVGHASGTECGDVETVFATPPANVSNNTLLLETDYCSAGGDSGGPVYTRMTNDGVAQGTAFSTHVASSGGTGCESGELSYSSHISAVEAALGLQVWCGGGLFNGCQAR